MLLLKYLLLAVVLKGLFCSLHGLFTIACPVIVACLLKLSDNSITAYTYSPVIICINFKRHVEMKWDLTGSLLLLCLVFESSAL